MKFIYFLFISSLLVFENPIHKKAFTSKSRANLVPTDKCSKLLDEAFKMTITRDLHPIDYGYYGEVISKVAFTEFCDYSMNERVNLLIVLAYYQEKNVSTVIGSTYYDGINKKYRPLLLLLATSAYTHDSLMDIRGSESFLNKLDKAHRNIYLKVESYAKKIKNRDELKRKIREYYIYITSRDWFFNKYKKYFIIYYK